MRRNLLCSVVLAWTAAVGCSRKDVQTIAKIGGTLTSRANQALAQAPRMVPQQVSAVEHVLLRLNYDRLLEGCGFVLKGSAERLILSGTVHDESQRQRALEIARTTIDIIEVVDALDVIAPTGGPAQELAPSKENLK
jgi:hypothetical protein